MNCARCQKRLSRKTARQIDGEVVCSACMFAPPAKERPEQPEFDEAKLKWQTSENLRWLAHNIPGGYMPCGQLRSLFLYQVAECLDRHAAEASDLLRDSRIAQTGDPA